VPKLNHVSATAQNGFDKVQDTFELGVGGDDVSAGSLKPL
jgi:hypothetical protein